MGFADADGVLEAGLADGAGGADGLGPRLSLFLLVLALHGGGREEDGSLRAATRGLHLPELFRRLRTQRVVDPLSVCGRYRPRPGATRGELSRARLLTCGNTPRMPSRDG